MIELPNQYDTSTRLQTTKKTAPDSRNPRVTSTSESVVLLEGHTTEFKPLKYVCLKKILSCFEWINRLIDFIFVR
jgi:hypothetical protein